MTRQLFPINRSWLYSPILAPGCTQHEFDDSGFERVTIPHTNKLLPWHSFDDRAYQFVSIYRRQFRVPAGLDGQRIFVDFDGVMAAAVVFINGTRAGEHRGGYTPFSIDITNHVRHDGDNLLAVEVDSTERPDIPPFGGSIDYLTFGGIYRDVRLRAVPPIFIENVFAKPVDVLDGRRRVDVRCFLDAAIVPPPLRIKAELLDGERVLAMAQADAAIATPGQAEIALSLVDLGPVELWDLDSPRLYQVRVRLFKDEQLEDEYTVRTGFRAARFTPEGFFLNGRRVKLRGLNRHQTYPYVGQAMPARVQRRDALILKQELKCNIVRTSHYPQSPYFLDCCDEIGLLVFEEIPGWQHIGDAAWKDLAVFNVEEMIRRDWNHPSIILWGVRINESPDDHEFYLRTNARAHALDDSRQTGGVRDFFTSELLEDVYTINDFNYPELSHPIHPLYLNTEFAGHTFSTKHIDNVERVQEHVFRHAAIHNQLASDDAYAGGIGWCAFDYNTHANFGSGDRICYHGVSDIFRIPKRAAGFYKSQCDPSEEIVLEPAFYWAIGDQSGSQGPIPAMICSNCDELKLYLGETLIGEITPDRDRFGHLPHPPFFFDRRDNFVWGLGFQDLRIDGYIDGKQVISRRVSARGVDAQFHLQPDDDELLGDGIDATRVVLRVTDEWGNQQPFATGAIQLHIDGPGEIIGESPFALVGGVGAVWIKTREAAGTIRLEGVHPVLGAQTVEIHVVQAAREAV